MMDKQQEQMNQNQSFTQASGSSKFQVSVEIGEPVKVRKEEQIENLTKNQQNKPDKVVQPKNSKRPRKTIEQEIAELDAKRERLMEKKRRQETHEKIIFGSTIIAMLKEMKVKNDKDREIIIKNIMNFSKTEQMKNEESIMNIIQKYKI